MVENGEVSDGCGRYGKLPVRARRPARFARSCAGIYDRVGGRGGLGVGTGRADHAAGAKTGWVEDRDFPELAVKFSGTALADLERIELSGDLALRGLIEDTLRHDPRNRRDKAQMAEGRDMGFFISSHDVHFSVSGGVATVLRIDTGAKFEKKFRRRKPEAG